MKSINFVLLGDPSIASQLGKKGTATDIAIYDRKTPDAVYTWTVPVTFPEKIQSLMQAVNIGEYAIFNVASLDRFAGEQIVALDYAGISSGFLLHSCSIDREKLASLLKSTLLSEYNIVESAEDLKTEIPKLEPKGLQGPLAIVVDHALDVKGVGTVVLGVVRRGEVKVYDELVIAPAMNQILVKSIQMHDDPVQSSASPSRVGLAIKGISADEISRGDIICQRDSTAIKTNTTLTADFAKSPFFKGDIVDNQMYMLSLGMQIRSVRVKKDSGDLLQIVSEKPVSYQSDQACVLLKPDSQGTRIVGKGKIQQ